MSVCSLLIATLVVAEEMASAHLCVMAKRPAVHARGVQRGLQVTVVRVAFVRFELESWQLRSAFWRAPCGRLASAFVSFASC